MIEMPFSVPNWTKEFNPFRAHETFYSFDWAVSDFAKAQVIKEISLN